MLTENDREFLDYYIACEYNSTKAALSTGRYKSESSAAAAATRILKKPEAQAYVRERVEERKEKTGLIASMDRVLQFYTEVMEGTASWKKVVAVTEKGEPLEIDVPPTLTEKLKGADGLAKAFGLDKRETKIDVGEKTLKTISEMSLKEKKALLDMTNKEIEELNGSCKP